jgi:hypothetical protein
MKRVLCLLLLMVLSSGCDEDKTTNPSQVLTIVPLKIGNQWTYEITERDSAGDVTSIATSAMAVVRDTMINDERWYDFSANGGPPMEYFTTNRIDGYWSGGPSGHLQYKYPAQKGDTYMFFGLVVTVESTADTVSIPASLFVCYMYRFETPGGNASSYLDHYAAPGIGLMKAKITEKLAGGETYVPWEEFLKAWVVL